MPLLPAPPPLPCNLRPGKRTSWPHNVREDEGKDKDKKRKNEESDENADAHENKDEHEDEQRRK